MKLPRAARELVPPILWNALHRIRRPAGWSRAPCDEIRFSGDYGSWQEAEHDSTGYSLPLILERTCVATRKARDREVAFERDSVVFRDPQYPFPVLAGLLRAAACAGYLNVADFGGALGSVYYQCRDFIQGVRNLRWNVVEQSHYVDCGRREFADNILHFHLTLEDCIESGPTKPNVLLLSGVLQYLAEPYHMIERLVRHGIPHIVVDRTAFLQGGRERITVQTVPEAIYPASYPAWFFEEPKFLSAFVPSGYRLVSDFEGLDSVRLEGASTYFKGFIFERQP